MCSCASARKYSGRAPLVDRERAKDMLDGIALASDTYVRHNSPDPVFGSMVYRSKSKSAHRPKRVSPQKKKKRQLVRRGSEVERRVR